MDYLRFGREAGEKFVILPGLSLVSVMGAAQGIKSAYALLAENYDVYLFDHVKEEPHGYEISGMAEDTLKAIHQLGLKKIHLMGVSMGGMVAQTIALKEPALVSSLILCSTTMNAKHGNAAVFEEWKRLAEEGNVPALMESFGENVYTPSFYQQYKEIILASGQGATALDLKNFLISLNAIRHFDVSGRAKEIRCPALVLGAGEDRVLGKEAAREMAEALAAEMYIYEGYGHGVYDEAPDYLTRIDRFLRNLRQETHEDS